ncbi:MAG: penicillin acylase family protein, partial [Desulfobacteraceae bacterium]|nr:penicillin acylase family protein [Desulfobacteraceae bacterium]
MRKKVLITALIAALLLVFGTGTTAIAKKTNLLDIKSPAKKQTCLQDTVEIVVELKNGADPSTFKAWLNSKDITHLFQPSGKMLKAVVDPDDRLLYTYAEDIQTTRDDKGVWFIEGRKQKFRGKKARYNRLRTKVRNAKKRVDVDTCTFMVDSSLHDTFEAMGYAIATDRLWQIELYRRQAQGRLAEIFGPDLLESDVFMRTIGYSDAELTDGFANLDAESKAVIAGYVAGINRRIEEVSG